MILAMKAFPSAFAASNREMNTVDSFKNSSHYSLEFTDTPPWQCWRILTDPSSERKNLRFFTLQVPRFQVQNLKINHTRYYRHLQDKNYETLIEIKNLQCFSPKNWGFITVFEK